MAAVASSVPAPAPSGTGSWRWAAGGPAELAEIALTYGISAFILMSDDAATIELFASEVAPATRELVAAAGA